MKFSQWFKDQIIKRETNKLRKELKLAIDKNINDDQYSIDNFTKIYEDFKKHNYSKHDSFLNLCIFSDVVSIDLTILVEKYRFAERKQEKKLFARVMSIVILDFLDNTAVLIGSNCLAELKRNNMLELMDEFKLMHKKFSTFKKDNERLLREIRNNTIAHKTKDALLLSKQINDLNEDEIYQFGLQFKIYIQEFVILSTKVINYISEYMSEGRKI
ncbi:hypothetical protein [Flavobacterium sp.]|jgi:hypothetical protein|uniref:hypothetical protein n=1 Tax=Flavobacterium sp. TaxID=239 RepID=UPI0037C0A908